VSSWGKLEVAWIGAGCLGMVWRLVGFWLHEESVVDVDVDVYIDRTSASWMWTRGMP